MKIVNISNKIVFIGNDYMVMPGDEITVKDKDVNECVRAIEKNGLIRIEEDSVKAEEVEAEEPVEEKKTTKSRKKKEVTE